MRKKELMNKGWRLHERLQSGGPQKESKVEKS